MRLNDIPADLAADLPLREEKLRALLRESGADACLLTGNCNLAYLLGRVLDAYYYLPAEGESLLFYRRNMAISGENIFQIKKPEQIPQLLADCGAPLPKKLILEEDEISAAEYLRLRKVFAEAEILGRQPIARMARSVKTALELQQYRECGRIHGEVYARVPSLYRPGMSDYALTLAIEHALRQAGHIGIMRTFGFRMEAGMGIVVSGKNAEVASPYDFVCGGAGQTPLLPLGAHGEVLRDGQCLLADICGCFGGYLTDLSRAYSIGKAPDIALAAHETALEIQAAIVEAGKPGALCSELYETALAIAEKRGFAENFMGYGQQAKFVGHGVGLEINELPVLSGGYRQPLTAGQVIALEPKMVLPGIGAVGVENTFIVTEGGLEKITLCDDAMQELS